MLKDLIPSNWKEVHKDNYKLLNIQSSENIECLGSYIVKKEGDESIVSFLNYIGFGKEFLILLDKTYENIIETDEIIDGKPENKNYENSSISNNLYHGFSEYMQKMVYMVINRVFATSNDYAYFVQMFIEVENGLNCVQSTIKFIDEDNIIDSVLNHKNIQQILDIFIKISK